MIDHLAYVRELPGLEAAAEIFDEAVRSILPHGCSGQALWFCRSDEGDPSKVSLDGYNNGGKGLRVEIDIDVDRAALTWLPDESIAVELPPGDPLRVMWFLDAPVITIPGTTVRTSAATARRAVIEYLATGHRPSTGITWIAPEPMPATDHGPWDPRHTDGGPMSGPSPNR
ncbi:hypothetical protein Acsp03_71300 [Actinomadura sp. NBRC 104412]|nr:hypothetical protein Acsp03_71300 [Actinomadura sp. NBRC 104412]